MARVTFDEASRQFARAGTNLSRATPQMLKDAGRILERQIHDQARQAAGSDRTLSNLRRGGALDVKWVIKGNRGFANAVGPWGIRDNSYIGGRTRAHVIRAKKARMLKYGNPAKYRKQVWHPGSARAPYWKRATDRAKPLIGKQLPDLGKEAVAGAFGVPWKARRAV